MSKQSNRTKPEYIERLPIMVYEFKSYETMLIPVRFDRYWWDSVMNRLIMKPKQGQKYKVVHPMKDKRSNDRFVHLRDINDKVIFVNYDWLEFSHSIGYYLSIDNYDYDVKQAHE